MITELWPGQIFVFGSNTSGKHIGGAALQAKQWGAKDGLSKGLSGRTYAIETMIIENQEFIGWDKIKEQLLELCDCAMKNDDYQFLLTAIGCGIAGGNLEDLEKILEDIDLPENIKKLW